MIHEIYPFKLRNEYVHKKVTGNSVIFSFKDDDVLCRNREEADFPLYKNISGRNHEFIYLFEIDGTDYFFARQGFIKSLPDFSYESIEIFRTMKPKHLAFAGLTAYHLYRWYRDNNVCGRCASPFILHNTDGRELVCEKCDNHIFPKIAPVVIVGVTDGDKLLMTKLAHSKYKNYALIAGYIEIGESAEEAVKREVMEEVGIAVKDIKYYKSQPWGYSGSLLLGYYANLDDKNELNIASDELAKAEWIARADITNEYEDFSLTNEMICNFKNGKT